MQMHDLQIPLYDNSAHVTSDGRHMTYFTFMLPCIAIDFFLITNQTHLIIQIYSVLKLYMFRASSLPIIRSSILYIRHW
jgi:hypothetical protein